LEPGFSNYSECEDNSLKRISFGIIDVPHIPISILTCNIRLTMNQKGFGMITSVVVLLSVSLSIGLTIALMEVSELETQSIGIQSEMAFYYSDICANEAIFKLKQNASYSGEIINFQEGSCSVSVSAAPNPRTIQSEGDFNGMKRNIEITGNLNHSPGGEAVGFDIVSWEEVF